MQMQNATNNQFLQNQNAAAQLMSNTAAAAQMMQNNATANQLLQQTANQAQAQLMQNSMIPQAGPNSKVISLLFHTFSFGFLYNT